MKNLNLFLFGACAAIACACDPASLDIQESASADSGSPATINLEVSDSYYTRASGVSQSAEKTINGIQAFVFRDDGTLDAYGASSGTTMQLKATSGGKNICVVANAPAMDDVMTREELMSRRSMLRDNTMGNFVMSSGLKDVFLISGDNNVSVVVDRLSSRVEVLKITNAMTSAQYRNKTFRIVAMYLTNASSDVCFGPASTPSGYYNQMGYQSSEADGLLYDNFSGGQQIAWNESIRDPHYLYAYPNPSEDTETTGGTWSPRSTRLVLKAQLGDTVYYYPIVLPVPFVGGKSYKIEEVRITRPGSLDEDVPVSFSDCSFTVTVSDWTVQDLGSYEI